MIYLVLLLVVYEHLLRLPEHALGWVSVSTCKYFDHILFLNLMQLDYHYRYRLRINYDQ